jgi:hypothetical protein
MSKFKVELNKIECVDGQGAGEGNLEVRLKISEGAHSVTWPSATGTQKIDNGGSPTAGIDWLIGTYTVDSGTITKSFDIALTEEDSGTLGADDHGSGTISFDLSSSMSPAYKSATMDLFRDHMNKTDGKVKVTLKAYKV